MARALNKWGKPYLFDEDKMIKVGLFPRLTAGQKRYRFHKKAKQKREVRSTFLVKQRYSPPVLFDPFKRKMITVPTIKNLFHFNRCEENQRHSQDYLVRKAILTSDPTFTQNRPCHIVLQYQRRQKIDVLKMKLEAWVDSRNEEITS